MPAYLPAHENACTRLLELRCRLRFPVGLTLRE